MPQRMTIDDEDTLESAFDGASSPAPKRALASAPGPGLRKGARGRGDASAPGADTSAMGRAREGGRRRRTATRTPSGRALEIASVGSTDTITVVGAGGAVVARLEIDEAGCRLYVAATSHA